MQEIDTSNGVLFPFYDQDTNMVYLCGKVCLSACLHLCLSITLNYCVNWCRVLLNIPEATMQ